MEEKTVSSLKLHYCNNLIYSGMMEKEEKKVEEKDKTQKQ